MRHHSAWGVAHISDPHFGTVVPAVHAALLAELHLLAPQVIVFSGDITQRARGAQFRLARDFIAALPRVPVLCVPGNHDLPLFDVFTRALRPYARYRRHVSRELEPVHAGAHVAVVGVDATRRWRHKDGTLRRHDIERIGARLDGLSQAFRVVVTHQPLAAPLDSEQHNVAHGARHALVRWLSAGADLFLGGHIHLPYCLEVHDGAGNRGIVLQAGTCLSRRVRAGVPNSYNVITLDQDETRRTMHVERRDFDAIQGRFARAGVHEAVAPPRGGRTGSEWRFAPIQVLQAPPVEVSTAPAG